MLQVGVLNFQRCRICEGCNEERIPKDIADMTGGICINCDVEKYTSEIK